MQSALVRPEWIESGEARQDRLRLRLTGDYRHRYCAEEDQSKTLGHNTLYHWRPLGAIECPTLSGTKPNLPDRTKHKLWHIVQIFFGAAAASARRPFAPIVRNVAFEMLRRP